MMRRWIMLGALGLTLLACWWVDQAEQPSTVASSMATPRVRARVPLAQAMPQLPAATSTVTPASASVALPLAEQQAGVNLFSAMQEPVADSAAVTAAVPVSPYTYAGRLQEDGRWTVFLTDGQQQYVLHEGDQFAAGWKVAVLDQQKVILQHAADRFEIRLDHGLDNGVVF
jgi:hypothetical protein